MENLLSGKILWSYDFEISQRDWLTNIALLFSGTPPFHAHEGDVLLTASGLLITGDRELHIPIHELTQLSIGFDDIFSRTLAKNGGVFWQPFRISFNEGNSTQTIYTIIDYNGFVTRNQVWFDALKRLLAD